MALTDEEAIALAMLHGCKFVMTPNKEASRRTYPYWWAIDDWDEEPHLIEKRLTYEVSAFRSREELAHAYCEYNKLLGE